MGPGEIFLGRGLRCLRHGRNRHINQIIATSISSPSRLRQCSRPHSTQATPLPPKRSRTLPLLIIGIVLGSSVYYLSTPPSKHTLLNNETFVPYTITSREAISPGSFIFTISPHHPNPSPLYLLPGTSTWRHPLWCVEFKHPQVQIARHYTPLPPQDGEDPADGTLRFYIRAVGGGEMSTYLSRLGIGQDVWLRGPHAGFDVTKRLGKCNSVVFLAGGTGIAPGMQVAKAVLDESRDANTRVTLLWAVRKREELQAVEPVAKSWWNFWSKNRVVDIHPGLEAPSPVARQLTEMKEKYGDRLRIRVAIDEERTYFQEADLQNAILSTSAKSPVVTDRGCRLHDPKVLEKAPEFETLETATCECATPGKNLFVVSGPDGFIRHYAGPKDWFGGQQIQAPVGGVAAQLQRKYPHLAHEWLVLKL